MLQLFNSKYQYLQNLAKGSNSQVVLVLDITKNRLCALKIILKELLEDPLIAKNMKREILIHRNLSHKNIVKLYETFEDDTFLYLAMDYCTGGTLKQSVYNEDAIFRFFHDVLDAIDYLHGQNIIYRDLKPENILIDNGTFKLCDFGNAIQLNDQIVKEQIVINEYSAPELLIGEYDQKADVWSLGMIELLHGQKPKLEVQVNEKLDEDLQILLYAMLTRPVQQRPSCKQIFLCKWFKKMMKQNKLYNKYEHEQLKTKLINKQVQIKTLNNCCFDLKQASISDALSDATTAPMIPNSIQNSADSLYDSIPMVENPANPQM